MTIIEILYKKAELYNKTVLSQLATSFDKLPTDVKAKFNELQKSTENCNKKLESYSPAALADHFFNEVKNFNNDKEMNEYLRYSVDVLNSGINSVSSILQDRNKESNLCLQDVYNKAQNFLNSIRNIA